MMMTTDDKLRLFTKRNISNQVLENWTTFKLLNTIIFVPLLVPALLEERWWPHLKAEYQSVVCSVQVALTSL